MTSVDEAVRAFSKGAPYVCGSKTSKAAAKSIGPKLTETQRKVYDYIMSCGTMGATDEEVIEAMMHCGMSMNTPRARRVELVDCGMVIDSGVTRAGKSGRNMVVWEGYEMGAGKRVMTNGTVAITSPFVDEWYGYAG